MAFLKLEIGDYYALEVPGAGTVVWTKGSPVPDVDIPLEVIQRAGLLSERVPKYDREGHPKESRRRFKVVPRPVAVKVVAVDPLEDDDLDLSPEERELLRADSKPKTPAPKK